VGEIALRFGPTDQIKNVFSDCCLAETYKLLKTVRCVARELAYIAYNSSDTD